MKIRIKNQQRGHRRAATSYNIGIDFTGSFAGCFNSFGYGYIGYFFKNIAIIASKTGIAEIIMAVNFQNLSSWILALVCFVAA